MLERLEIGINSASEEESKFRRAFSLNRKILKKRAGFPPSFHHDNEALAFARDRASRLLSPGAASPQH